MIVMMEGVLLKFFVLYFLVDCASGVVTIQNNAYSGLMIVIHNRVQEDPAILENLKSLITSSSNALYKATRKRSYFGDATIVVPSDWSSQPHYESAGGGNRFSSADIRIDLPNPQYGNSPYTLQPGGCGEPGHYIHLTPDFVKELDGKTTQDYGHPGKTLVHEWAHLRYGIFDEYGDEDDARTPAYYVDESNQIRVTGCGENIKGWLLDNEYNRCHMQENGLPDENCQFYPAEDNDHANGSIMYMHWLSSVDGFCTDSEELKHNSVAPNQQNLFCNGESTWSIVLKHPDFFNDRNPPRDNVDTTPKIRFIQPRKNDQGNYILLLDISGSMSGNRITMLHRAASRFVKDQIPNGSRLGIVSFSTDAKTVAEMTVITNSSRATLMHYLPQNVEGSTAVGKGLQHALQVLRKQNTVTQDAVIILISDGEENVAPVIDDVIPEILKAKVKIHTIAFGSKASKHLEKLIRLTGGRGYFYSDEEIQDGQSSVLQSAFFEVASSTQADVEFQPIEIINRVLTLGPNIKKSGQIVVDKSVGKNTRFTFAYNVTGKLEITLKSPDGKIYNSGNKEYRNDDRTKTVTITVASAKRGKWSYDITNKDNGFQGISLSVTSEPKDIKKQPIRIRAWINDVQINFRKEATNAKVFAEVKKEFAPVIDATVIAEVERPDGKHIELTLRDTGAGADIKKNDGIYTAYFSEFQGDGRYSVSARVENDGKAKLLLRKQKSNGALKARHLPKQEQKHSPQVSFSVDDLDPPAPDEDDNIVFEPIGEPFQRSLLAGSFRVENWQPGDFFPPNRVIDLQVDEVSIKEKTTSLSWTSSGDDMDSGTASRIELRYHTNPKFLHQNFNKSFEVTDANLVAGNFTPLVSGTRHKVVFGTNLKEEQVNGKTFYFALRYYDKVDNSADLSNIAMAYFYVETPVDTTTPNNVTPTTSSAPSNVLFLVLDCIVVFSVTIAVIFY